MKVLLINPPWFEGSTFDKLISSNPPLSIAYVAAYLEKNGYPDIEILDMKVLKTTFEEIEEKIKQTLPDIVGISSATGQISSTSKIIDIVKRIKPDTITIVGGWHPSALPEKTLKEVNADICVIGEGEITFLEVVRAIEEKKDLEPIEGICFRNKKGEFITNQRRKLIENLDELPLPARHLLPSLKTYQSSSGFGENKLHASVMTSRGCPFRCGFCDKSIFGRTFRMRSVKNTVNEIEMLLNKYGVKEIRFFDDLFAVNEKRVKDICDEILRRNLKFDWCCEARVNTVTPDMLKIMKEAGCTQIDYGVESGSQEILDLLNKDTTLDQIKQAIKWTKDVGIKTKAYFLLGLPGETKKHIEETINFSKSLEIDYAAFFFYSPYPGTPLYNSLSQYGDIVAKSWDEYITFETPSFLPKGMDKSELEKLYKRSFYEFYLRPKHIFQLLKEIKNPSTLFSYAKAGLWAISHKFIRNKEQDVTINETTTQEKNTEEQIIKTN